MPGSIDWIDNNIPGIDGDQDGLVTKGIGIESTDNKFILNTDLDLETYVGDRLIVTHKKKGSRVYNTPIDLLNPEEGERITVNNIDYAYDSLRGKWLSTQVFEILFTNANNTREGDWLYVGGGNNVSSSSNGYPFHYPITLIEYVRSNRNSRDVAYDIYKMGVGNDWADYLTWSWTGTAYVNSSNEIEDAGVLLNIDFEPLERLSINVGYVGGNGRLNNPILIMFYKRRLDSVS